eukprot:m.80637 g.80637  ORF g.80637 m.80637 type:complete len:277 (-) comp8626_c0_seq2:290-1120(-)
MGDLEVDLSDDHSHHSHHDDENKCEGEIITVTHKQNGIISHEEDGDVERVFTESNLDHYEIEHSMDFEARDRETSFLEEGYYCEVNTNDYDDDDDERRESSTIERDGEQESVPTKGSACEDNNAVKEDLMIEEPMPVIPRQGSFERPVDTVWRIRVKDYSWEGTHYVYEIHLSLLGETWKIWRRFREIRKLHVHLQKIHRVTLRAIEFPRKHIMTTTFFKSKMDEEFLNTRVDDLNTYLNTLISKLYCKKGSMFYEVDRSMLQKKSPFFRRGPMTS